MADYFLTVDPSGANIINPGFVLRDVLASLQESFPSREYAPSLQHTHASYNAIRSLLEEINRPEMKDKPEEEQLIREKSAYANNFIDKWRMLVAMIALNSKDNGDYNLAFKPINLDASGDKQSLLCKIVAKEIKNLEEYYNNNDSLKHDVLKGTDWSKTYIILIEDSDKTKPPYVLGMTHPRLLVLPSKNIEETIVSSGRRLPEYDKTSNCVNLARWIRNIIIGFINDGGEGSTVDQLLRDFEKDLIKFYDTNPESGLTYEDSVSEEFLQLEKNSFVPDGIEGTFNVLNSPSGKYIPAPPPRPVINPTEWRVFLSAFALNDLLNLGITYEMPTFLYGGNIPFASEDDDFVFYPSNEYKNLDLQISYGLFENICTFNWLLKLEKFAKEQNKPKLLEVAESVNKLVVEDLRAYFKYDSVERVTSDTELIMGDSYFKHLSPNMPADNPFHTSINKRRAGIVYGRIKNSSGEIVEINDCKAVKEVREGWRNVLYMLALNDIYSFGLSFKEVSSGIMPNAEECAYTLRDSMDFGLYQLKGGRENHIATTSKITLFELCDGIKQYDKDGKSLPSISAEAHIANDVVKVGKEIKDMFDHERLLLATWIEKFIENIEQNSNFGRDNKAYKAVMSILYDEIAALGLPAYVGLKPADVLKDAELWGDDGLYSFKARYDNLDNNQQALAYYIPGYVVDNLFEKKLVYISEGKLNNPNELVCSQNSVNSTYLGKSIYAVYKVLFSEGKVSGNEIIERTVLLPFQDRFLDKLERNYNDTQHDNRSTGYSEPFGIESIGTHFYENEGVYEVRVMPQRDRYLGSEKDKKFLGGMEIKKRYFADNCVERLNRNKPLGVAAVWPNVEIPGFSEYRLNYVVRDGNEYAADIKITNKSPLLEDTVTLKLKIGDEVKNVPFTKKSYSLDKFPKYTRYEFKSNGTASGIILNTPDKSFPDAAGHVTEAVVGIDFGTANSLIYYKTSSMKGGDPTGFNWSEDKGKVLTGNIEQLDKVAMVFYRLPESTESGNIIFPSIASYYKASGGHEPFVDGNIVVLPETEVDAETEAVLASDAILSELKWANNEKDVHSKPRRIFLKQMLMSACIAVVKDAGGPVGTIKVRVSYPGIFTDEHLRNLQNMWGEIVSELNYVFKFSRENDETIQISRDSFFTESYCVAFVDPKKFYDSKTHISFDEGVMVVDIGGGSFDLVIVKDEKDESSDDDKREVLFELSRNMGARKILGPALSKGDPKALSAAIMNIRKELIHLVASDTREKEKNHDLLGNDDAMKIPFDAKQYDDNVKKIIVATGKTEGDKVVADLTKVGKFANLALNLQNFHGNSDSNNSDEEKFMFNLERAFKYVNIATSREGLSKSKVKSLGVGVSSDASFLDKTSLAKIEFACASIMYFLGSTVKALRKEEKYKNLDIKHVLLAGNGAGVFEWLTSVSGSMRNDDTKSFMGDFYKAGLGQKDLRLEVLSAKSSKRKHEVAQGLTQIDETKAKASKTDSKYPKGEEDVDVKKVLLKFLSDFYELSKSSTNRKAICDAMFKDYKSEWYTDGSNPFEKQSAQLLDFIEDQCKIAKSEARKRTLDFDIKENIILSFALNMLDADHNWNKAKGG